MSQFSFEKDVLPVVVRLAWKRFGRYGDAEDRVDDATSVAWEQFNTAPPDATPFSLGTYAVKRVTQGRQFRQSVRSIDGPPCERTEKPRREPVNLEWFTRCGDDPAELAALRIDFPAWMAGLSDRKAWIARALWMGDRVTDIAEEIGCCPGRISTVRRELHDSWQAFTA